MGDTTNSFSERDFPVEMSGKDIRRIRDGLTEIATTTFPSTEFALTVASLAAGGVLSDLLVGGGVQTNAWPYLILLPVAVGGTVAYFMLKRISTSIPAARARVLLEILASGRSSPLESLAGRWNLTSLTKSSGKASTGFVNIELTQGRASAAGILYGESNQPIAQISAEICDYRESTHQFVLLYVLSAINDNGSQVLARCIFDGVVFAEESQQQIRGSWFHLEGDDSGSRPWGHASFARPA